jgi:hypothetical protein
MTVWNEELNRLFNKIEPWFQHGELKENTPEKIREYWKRFKIEYAKEEKKMDKLCGTDGR